MKKKQITLELMVGIASLIVSIISVMGVVWVGAFKLSTLTHEVHDVKERLDRIDIRLDKMDGRLDKMEDEFHKIDIRVTTLEHR